MIAGGVMGNCVTGKEIANMYNNYNFEIRWGALLGVRNSKRHGKCKGWFRDGNLKFVFFHKEGQIHGAYDSWFRNGTKGVECVFKGGDKEGKYLSWFPNGGPNVFCNYRNGRLNGECINWLETDDKESEIVSKIIYNNGEPINKIFY